MIKKFSKLIAMTLFTAMLATGLFATDISAAAGEKADNYDYNDAINFFVQLDVINEDEINDEAMSRGAFVDLLMRALNNPYDYVSAAHRFSDVTAEQPWFGSVGKAYNLGIISGYSENEFRPYETLSRDQATQVLKNALNARVENDGVALLKVLTDMEDFYDIFDGVDTSKEYFTTRDSLMLFYNMLTIPRKIIDMDGKLKPHDDLLKECWNAYVMRGIVQATDICSIVSGEPCSNGSVMISGKTFLTGGARYESFLGYTVDAYIRTEHDTEYTLCLNIVSAENNVLELDSTMISENCFDSTTLTYVESDSGKERKAKVEKAVTVIYNGVFRGAEFDKSDFDIKLGKIRLIDHDDNGYYDIAMLEEYTTLVAAGGASSGVASAGGLVGEEIVVDYFNPDVYVKFSDHRYENTVELYFDGVLGEPSKIKKGDLINYYESLNGDKHYVKAYVVRDTVAGELNRIGRDYFTINGKELRKAYQYKTTVTHGDKVTIGSYGIFRLNFLGEVAIFEGQPTDNLFYGVVLKVLGGEFDDELLIKMYTTGMDLICFETTPKFRIDGNRYKTADAARTKLCETKFDAYNDDAELVCQLVKYKIKDGAISDIYTTATDVAEAPKIAAPFANRDYSTVGNVYGSIVRDFRVNQETFYFLLPPMKDGKFPYEEMCVTDIDGIKNVSNVECQAYDTDNYGIADVVAVYYTYDTTNYDAETLYIFENSTFKLDKNGDTVRELILYSGGKLLNYQTANMEIGEDLEPGDIIFIVKDYENCVRYVNKIYSLHYPRLTQGLIVGDNKYRAKGRVGVQYMTAVSDGWAWLTYDPMKSKDPTVEPYHGLWNLGSVNITLFDEESGTANLITANDLPLYISSNNGNDYLVLTFENYGQMKDCIIYDLKER